MYFIYLIAILNGIIRSIYNVIDGDIPIANKPAYVIDPKNPAPPVPEDQALTIDLKKIKTKI